MQKILQNAMEWRCLINEMLLNTEAETMECYEMIHKTDLGTYILFHPVY